MMTLKKWLEKAKQNGIVKEKKRSNPSKEPRDLIPKPIRAKSGAGGPGFKKVVEGPVWERFKKQFPSVNAWLELKPYNSQKSYGNTFARFCRIANILPKDFGEMELRAASNLAWAVIKQFIVKGKPHVAMEVMKACVSFYRFYNPGMILPFDRQPGGSHRIPIPVGGTKEKFHWGTIEQAREKIYNILSKCSDLRSECIFTIALATGMRRNVYPKLKWKHCQNFVDVDSNGQSVPVMIIKVTPKLDQKLQSARVPFYYAFMSDHALQVFKRYEAKYRNDRGTDGYVFYSVRSNKMKQMKAHTLYMIFKNLVRKAGYPEKQLWFHEIRLLFKKFVRNSPIRDDEFKEFIMGHTLSGSRENYAERDPLELAKEYLKINFEPPVEYLKEQLRKAVEKRQKLGLGREHAEIGEREAIEERIDEEYIKPQAGWQTPKMEDRTVIDGQLLPYSVPKTTAFKQPTVKEPMKPIVERIEKPAPKNCLRGKTFGARDTDAYCHNVCSQQSPNEYKACQELQMENPELFS